MQTFMKYKKVVSSQICIIFAVFLCVVGSLFCSLPVHAAEVSEAETSGLKMFSLIGSCDYVLGDGANSKDYPDFPMFNVNSDPTVFYVSDDVYLSYVQTNDWKSKNVSNAPLTYAFVSTENFTIIKKSNGKFFKQSPSRYQVNGNDLYFFRASFSNSIGQNGQVYAGDIYVANLRVNHSVYFYNNDSEMWSYLYSVAKDKIDTSINDIDISTKEHFDSAYSLTGFTANNKINASWTGTTQRSNMTDLDVNEYVRVAYAYAPKDDPDNIGEFTQLDTDYSTSAKSLTVALSDLAPSDDAKFVRQVNIIPYYSDSDGPFGNYYYGVLCKIYFNQDGSIDRIVRDFSQGSSDYSYKHIFASDKYSTDIPAPELSAISHNGFTLLNNSNNDYYVDIILESTLYGVKMEKNAGTWLPVVDTDWIYNSHYYNFADTSQIAINNDVIYIPNLFSVNPENDLVDDFKKWSSEYSSYSSLPSMSFLKRSTAARTRYVDQFLFKDDSKYSDSEQLKFSHMAESVFYVRYYNKSMAYGPWVRYKFRDGYVAQVIDGTLGGAYIDVGQVDTDDSGNVRVDEKGNPIVSDNVSGRQDYDTGESDFSDGSFSLDLSDVTKFFDYLKKIFESVTGALSSFGSVVAACFGFLPGELVNALIFGICVMMFIGIIKAVKG